MENMPTPPVTRVPSPLACSLAFLIAAAFLDALAALGCLVA